MTSSTLEKKFNLTRRQLGYSFNKINEWLLTNNLPTIERTSQGRFIIDQEIFTNLGSEQESSQAEISVLSETHRVYLIITMLLNSAEELSLNHFTIELDVSKNTILSDLKQVQEYVSEYKLSIRYSRKFGYLLEGNEFQIRKLLINITAHMLQLNGGQHAINKLAGIEPEEIEQFREKIENVENSLNLKYTDEKVTTMPYILLLVLRRIERGYEINSFSIKYEELSNTKEYQATEELFHSSALIPVQERLFITLHLLTANVYWADYLSENDDLPNLRPAIEEMISLFENSACVYFQDRGLLLNTLLQHMKPAYYRIKYQLTESINMEEALSQKFKVLHHLVKQSTTPLKRLIGTAIPENETTYITMLIGGWMTRQGESTDQKVKAIVVCPHGVSVSRLMYKELTELFPEFVFLDSLSVREFQAYDLEYDIIFSSTYLKTEKKLFIIKALLEPREKNRLYKQVMMELQGYLPQDIDVGHLLDIIKNHADINNEQALMEDLQTYIYRDEDSAVKQSSAEKVILLNEMISPQYITQRDSVQSWEEAIQIGAEPLVKSGKIEPAYVDAVIERTGEDPYIVIGPHVAIPHAAPEDGVNEVGMSLLKLKKGLTYAGEYTIHVIIVIAAVDKQQHLHALTQLIKLNQSKKDMTKLLQADSKEQIHDQLTLYSSL